MTRHAILFSVGLDQLGVHSATPRPAELTSFFDRPFIQHVIEQIASAGIEVVDVVLSEKPERFEALLGSGIRWGISIRCHLVREAATPYGVLARLQGAASRRVVFGHADCLPCPGSLRALVGRCMEERETVFPIERASQRAADRPPGWLVTSLGALRDVDCRLPRTDFLHALGSAPGVVRLRLEEPLLGVTTPGEVLASHEAVLSRNLADDLLLPGLEEVPGVRVSPSARVHPSAQLLPPLYIGRDCVVSRESVIGPGAIVGSGTFLEPRTRLRNSCVEPGAVVRGGSEAHGVLAGPSGVISTDETTSSRVEVFPASRRALDALGRSIERITACLTCALLAPLTFATFVALTMYRRESALSRPEVVRLEQPSDAPRTFRLCTFDPLQITVDSDVRCGRLRHLFQRSLPGLVNVALGHMHFVGLDPRTPRTLEALPAEWRANYERGRLGLISEFHVRLGSHGSPEDQQAADLIGLTTGFVGRARLLLAYLTARPIRTC